MPAETAGTRVACLDGNLTQQLKTFYAFQLLSTTLAVAALCVTGSCPATLLIHGSLAISWMLALVVLSPQILYRIDPYVVLSFFPWMHFSILLLYLNGDAGRYSESLLARASVTVLLGYGALTAGLLPRPSIWCRGHGPNVSHRALHIAGCVCLLFSAPPIVCSNSFFELCSVPPTLQYATVFSIPAVGLLLGAALIKKSSLDIALLLTATLLAFVDTSRRALVTVVLMYVFASIYLVVVRRRGVIPRRVVVWFAFGIIVIFFGSIARRAQTRAHSADGGFAGDFVRNLSTIRDLNAAPIFLEALDVYPDSTAFEGGRTVLALAVNPIPRALWTKKPISMSVTMAFRRAGQFGTIDFTGDQWAQISRGSYSVTFLGEMWANFGWPGVVIGPFLLALIYRCLEQHVSMSRTTLLWPFYMGGIVGAVLVQNRGDLLAANYYAMAVLLFGSCVFWLASRWVRFSAGQIQFQLR